MSAIGNEKIYLTERISTIIRKVREDRNITAADLARYLGHDSAWMSKVESCNTKYITYKDIVLLETRLGVKIYDTDMESFLEHENAELRKEIEELKKENQSLANYIAERWKEEQYIGH